MYLKTEKVVDLRGNYLRRGSEVLKLIFERNRRGNEKPPGPEREEKQ